MRWRNTETPTFSGAAGSAQAPAVAETFELLNRDETALLTFSKGVDGALTHNLTGATSAELDQLNDVSAYQETIVAAGALSVTKVFTALALVGTGAVTLAVPSATMLGQVKTIEMTVDNGDVTLALTNVVGGSAATTCTFNTAGDQLVLVAGTLKWIVIKEQGVAMS